MHRFQNILLSLAAVGMLALLSVAYAQAPVAQGRAQWAFSPSGAWDKSWNSVRDDEEQAYVPKRDLGLSSLAYDKDKDRLYTACEKYPALLRFDAEGKNPQLIPLKASRPMDIEALSIHKGILYLVDEDGLEVADEDCVQNEKTKRQPYIYLYDLKRESLRPKPLRVSHDLELSVDCAHGNSSDKKSVEGLVVSDQWLFPERKGEQPPSDPYFYLLDEQTNGLEQSYATLSVATKDATGELHRAAAPVRFPLSGPHERLPELFLHGGKLHAIKSQYGEGVKSHYEIVRLIFPEKGGLGSYELAYDLNAVARELSNKKFSNNLEGATVLPDGSLFLVTDNENRGPKEKSDAPTGNKVFTHGKSALLRLESARK